MKVKDIMEPIRNWLTPEMSVAEAIKVMKRTKRGHGLPVNGIVVLDGAMNLTGILSNKDILKIILPPHFFFDEHRSRISWDTIRNEKTAVVKSTPVSRIMTEDVRTIAAEESILRCADILLHQQLRRLPVVRSDHKVVGIVYLRDVYNALTAMLTG